MKSRIILAVILLISIFASISLADARKVEHVVVLVLDGFRYKYLTEVPEEYIPNLIKLAKEGVYYTNFYTVFPSSTDPAHASLFSGCWPGSMGVFDSHGCSYDSPPDSIFNAAQRQGLLALEIVGYGVRVYKPGANTYEVIKSWARPGGIYMRGMGGHEARVAGQRKHAEEIVWAVKEYNPDVMYCRLPATDWGGHANGALDSPDEGCRKAMLELIKETDRLVGEVVKTLDELWGRENYVMFITADHGMTYAPNNIEVGEIEDYLLEHGFSVYVMGDIVALIYLYNRNEFDGVVKLLNSEEAKKKLHIQKVYWGREQMEKIYGPIDEASAGLCPHILLQPEPTYRYVEGNPAIGGSHNTLRDTDMHIPLICFGDGVKQGVKIDKRGVIVDITPTVAYLLGIKPPECSQGRILKEIFKK